MIVRIGGIGDDVSAIEVRRHFAFEVPQLSDGLDGLHAVAWSIVHMDPMAQAALDEMDEAVMREAMREVTRCGR